MDSMALRGEIDKLFHTAYWYPFWMIIGMAVFLVALILALNVF